MARPWYETLLELLAGALVRQELGGLSTPGNEPKSPATGILELPTGYLTPQPPPGIQESRSLEDCDPVLRARYEALAQDYTQMTGRQLFPTSTWRSPERQVQLYAQGRTTPGKIVTKLDGVNKKSRHNVYPSQAIDVCVDIDPGPGKHISWDPDAYRPLGELCARHGLVWGGDFKGFGPHGDYPHIELPPEAA